MTSVDEIINKFVKTKPNISHGFISMWNMESILKQALSEQEKEISQLKAEIKKQDYCVEHEMWFIKNGLHGCPLCESEDVEKEMLERIEEIKEIICLME